MKINSKNVTFEQLISASNPSNDTLEFEYDEYDMYLFPYEKDIPEGYYHSRVEHISNSQNKYGDACVDVCYKIFPTRMASQWENRLIDKITYFYIRQRYKRGSDPFRKFLKAMKEAGKLTSAKISYADLVGIKEAVHLTYQRDGYMGSITDRIPTKMADAWFFDDVSNKFDHSCEESEEV